ncbi:hypothetical protein PENANT_c017G02208 [Penicillium antarcticum]|uniref:Uncharacterized protein n=1 Tax=Penicillium antarcticum TaxID=416450 RepID=A0A1V6Q265_9EURO|nr:hypothetical protein PENANT_c017G02208 [Penicillium antarcticum]
MYEQALPHITAWAIISPD